MIDSESDNNSPTPPAGYTSWLDYAVEYMDVRAIEIESLFDRDSDFDRKAARHAARRELDNLRSEAEVLDKLTGIIELVSATTQHQTEALLNLIGRLEHGVSV